MLILPHLLKTKPKQVISCLSPTHPMAPKRSASTSPTNPRSPKAARTTEESISDLWRRIREMEAREKEMKFQIFLEQNPNLKGGVDGWRYFETLFKAEPLIIKAQERLADYYGEELQGHHTWDDFNLMSSQGRFVGVPRPVAMKYWKSHFPGVDFKEVIGISTTKSRKYKEDLRAGRFE